MSYGLVGFRAWLLQRVTAVYMALFLTACVFYWWAKPMDFTAWHAWFSLPLVKVGWGVFTFSVLMHAWIGLRDVVLDYVHSLALRVLILSAIALSLVGLESWMILILLGVGAG